MEVILIENVLSLGKAGNVLKVADGYARNYLIPRNLALPATESSVRMFNDSKKRNDKKLLKIAQDAESLKQVLDGRSVNIFVEVGAKDKMFGSVTAKDIAEMLKRDGIGIDKRLIELDEPIKGLGEYTVAVKLSKDIQAQIKVLVVKKDKT